MSDRRQFLKQLAFFGAMATTPFSLMPRQAAGQTASADGVFTVPHRQILRTNTPRTITIPDVGEYKVLKGDFHMHTLFSDGSVMPKDRVNEAVDNGMDVISITDHIEYRPNIGGNTLKLVNNDNFNISYQFAKPTADEKKLILVPGTEITKPAWHFNALFTEDVNKIAAVVDDWRQMLAVAVGQGAFVHWNHPNWVTRNETEGLKSGDPLRFFDEIEEARQKGHIHGLEVFNGTSFYPVALDWCNDRDLAPIVNSDIHQSEWEIYGHQNPLRPRTLIFAKDRTYESVKEAFFAKRTVGWAANMILGRAPLVEKLFAACVTLTQKPGILELVNKSDIPCIVQAGGTSRELPALGTVSIYRSDSLKKLTVSNWLVGMNQPLEVALG